MDALVGKALRSRRVRFWLATAGIATSTLLVLVLVAAYRSVRASVTGYAGQPGIDLWVAPVGTDNLIRSSSLFSSRLADSVGAYRASARPRPWCERSSPCGAGGVTTGAG